jgi:hypothetical protein
MDLSCLASAGLPFLNSSLKTGHVVSPTRDFDKSMWANLKELGLE